MNKPPFSPFARIVAASFQSFMKYDKLGFFLKGPKDREREMQARQKEQDDMLDAYVKMMNEAGDTGKQSEISNPTEVKP